MQFRATEDSSLPLYLWITGIPKVQFLSWAALVQAEPERHYTHEPPLATCIARVSLAGFQNAKL